MGTNILMMCDNTNLIKRAIKYTGEEHRVRSQSSWIETQLFYLLAI